MHRPIHIFTIIFLVITMTWAQWVKTSGPEFGTNAILAANDSTLFAGTISGVFRSTNEGVSWTQVNNGLIDTNVLSLAISNNTLFAGGRSGVYRSTDNGDSWTSKSRGLTTLDVRSLAVSGSTLFAGTFFDGPEGGGVFRSENNGDSWILVNNGWSNVTFTWVYSFAVGDSILFAGAYDDGVFRSKDNGDSWTDITNGLTDTSISSLALNGSTLFAGIEGSGVFRSMDNGDTWSPVNNGLSDTWVKSLTVSGSTLFAGTFSGIFRSTDNGNSWNEINNGLTSTYVISLGASGSSLFAGIHLDGLWRRPLSEITAEMNSFEPPASFGFVSKNLLRPGDGISFFLSHRVWVRLELYDILGKETVHLLHSVLDKGEHSARLEGDLSKGVYFLRLLAGGESRIQRVAVY